MQANFKNSPQYSRGVLRQLAACPACASDIKEQESKFMRQDDEALMPDIWNIYRCKQCSSTFINPQPAEESLAELYRDYLTHKPVESDPVFENQNFAWRIIRGYLKKRFSLQTKLPALNWGYFVFLLLPPLRHKLDRYGRNLTNKNFKNKGKLLDFGCGAGEFLGLARQMGWEVYGCDFDPIVVESCKKQGYAVQLGDVTSFSATEKFNVITMNQVIEHVSHPQQTVKDCFQALATGGCLWIGTPNPNAHGASIFGAAWAGWHPPYHLCLPAQDELVRWMKEAGFSRIQVLQRGPHAKFNWEVSKKLANKNKIKMKKQLKIKLYWIDFLNSLTPRGGEESIVIAFKD